MFHLIIPSLIYCKQTNKKNQQSVGTRKKEFKKKVEQNSLEVSYIYPMLISKYPNTFILSEVCRKIDIGTQ